MSRNNWDYAECDYYEDEYKSKLEKEYENKIHDIADFFEGILDQLYGNEKFDKSTLEFYIDECCTKLGLKMRSNNLIIESKECVLPARS